VVFCTVVNDSERYEAAEDLQETIEHETLSSFHLSNGLDMSDNNAEVLVLALSGTNARGPGPGAVVPKFVAPSQKELYCLFRDFCNAWPV